MKYTCPGSLLGTSKLLETVVLKGIIIIFFTIHIHDRGFFCISFNFCNYAPPFTFDRISTNKTRSKLQPLKRSDLNYSPYV